MGLIDEWKASTDERLEKERKRAESRDSEREEENLVTWNVFGKFVIRDKGTRTTFTFLTTERKRTGKLK